jgi:hypothetical protein
MKNWGQIDWGRKGFGPEQLEINGKIGKKCYPFFDEIKAEAPRSL